MSAPTDQELAAEIRIALSSLNQAMSRAEKAGLKVKITGIAHHNNNTGGELPYISLSVLRDLI